ncbi:tyrosine-type recombinase/integrase [Mycolicibacterium sp. 050232]|uniref:site-specific integrase n=1 Tax=Mycolicibacterium sp. 050232 TaxID=3113982 RepID=UPI002E2AB8AE|nr:tyrosine-type recombinase/integrase [Mycolicibacterium sp. 050232]MED5812938.1 tyrosine-type recombinase/integrase [Mycolicibacterium sp. 050232]
MSSEPTTTTTTAARTRRAEPINTHTARNGAVTYWFQVDVGTKPDGSRDRRKFTYRTKAEARKELRRITTEVAAGTYAKPSTMTVDQACDVWLAGRRRIRKVTVYSYENDLKPVRRYLGGKQLQKLTKADGDALVAWMLTEARTSPRHYRDASLAGQVVAVVAAHPEGISVAEVAAALPGDVHSALAKLLATGRVSRLRRGVYAPPAADNATVETATRGLSPQTVRSTLTTFSAVVQSYVDQGVLPRNVIALVERPKDADPDEQAQHPGDSPVEVTAKSWTLAEVGDFREAVRDHRLFACWLLSCYGMRRSEVLGLRWSAVDLDTGTLSVRRGRVSVGSDTVEGAPKSKRSRRDLPLPEDVTEALRALKTTQKREAMALGVPWSDDRLVAAREDGVPLRPESYTDAFHRLRARAGLRRIHLKGLRNTSVSLMLDQGHPPHIVAAWHGHDPAVTLSIYSDVKADELRAVGASLFA